jgi:hypothetical protein
VTELSETAQQVLQSLRDKPTLNTPTLIAMDLDSADKAEIEAALNELIAAGEVKHRPTGWKLAG